MEGVGSTCLVVVGVGIVPTVNVGLEIVVVIRVGVVARVMHFRPSSSKTWISAVGVCDNQQ